MATRKPLRNHIDNRTNAVALSTSFAEVHKGSFSGNVSLDCSAHGGGGSDETLRAGDRLGPTGSLPEEVMERILAHLSKQMLTRCMRVCRRWYRLCLSSRLWRRLDLAGKTIEEAHLHLLVDRGVAFMRCANTEVLNRSSRLPLPRQLDDRSPSRLTHLDLSMLSTTDTSIVADILQRCFHLRMLSLELVALVPAACRAIAQNTDLVNLNLALAQGLGMQEVRAIIDCCKSLQELNVSWTNMPIGAVCYLCHCCPATMRKLNMSGCKDTLTDDDVVALTRRCTDLCELDMSDCVRVTREGFITAVTAPNMRVLHASRCYAIEPVAYLEAGRLCELIIHGCVTDDGYRVLGDHLTKTRLNGTHFSTIARPTVGERRTSIWTNRVRDAQ